MVDDFHPSFYLVLLSFSLAPIQLYHPTHGLFDFKLFDFILHCFLSTHFHHVHPTM